MQSSEKGLSIKKQGVFDGFENAVNDYHQHVREAG